MTGLQTCTHCKCYDSCMKKMLKNPLAISLDCTLENGTYHYFNRRLKKLEKRGEVSYDSERIR